MTHERDLRLNLERMWREMEELIGAPFTEIGWRGGGAQTGFSPRVDVYYCERGEEPRGAGAGQPGVLHHASQ